MADFTQDDLTSFFAKREEEEKKATSTQVVTPPSETGFGQDDLDTFFAKRDNPTAGYIPFGQVQQDVDHRTLGSNDDWVKGSQNFFEMTYGYVPQMGDDKLEGYDGTTYREKIADYGLKQMAGFNFNIGDQVIDTTRILNSDQKMKESFVYMLDQYDNVNTSWHTAGQAGWEMMTDVTTGQDY